MYLNANEKTCKDDFLTATYNVNFYAKVFFIKIKEFKMIFQSREEMSKDNRDLRI